MGKCDDQERGRAAIKWIWLAGNCYLYLIVIFATAYLVALLGNFVDSLLQSTRFELPGGWTVRHGFWVIGAILGAIGFPLGWIRINGQAFRGSVDSKHQKPSTEASPETFQSKKETGVPARVLPSAAFFGLVGAFLGLFLGGSLLLIWFSLSMSPWPPDGWQEAVSTEYIDLEAPGKSHPRQRAQATRHPVAIY